MWGSHCGLTGYTYIMACFGERLSLHLSLQRHRDRRDQRRVMATSNWFQPHPASDLSACWWDTTKKAYALRMWIILHAFYSMQNGLFRRDWDTAQSYSLICPSQHIPSVRATGFVLCPCLSLKEPCHHQAHTCHRKVLTILSSNL